jgi:4'-phosphopantetheinyl transferase
MQREDVSSGASCEVEPQRGEHPGPGEVHLWRVDVAVDRPLSWEIRNSLSEQEMTRAEAFRFRADRHRYIACRGVLRCVLGGYLAVDPARLAFERNAHGKPRLAPPFDDSGLAFNLSHSESRAVIAVTSRMDVGVDVERVRDLPFEELARRFLAPEERLCFEASPPEARIGLFFEFWTRKEAYVKGRGEGLTIPFEGFSLDMTQRSAARLSYDRSHPDDAHVWRIAPLDVAAEYAGAVAVAGDLQRIRYRDWPAEADSHRPRAPSPVLGGVCDAPIVGVRGRHAGLR